MRNKNRKHRNSGACRSSLAVRMISILFAAALLAAAFPMETLYAEEEEQAPENGEKEVIRVASAEVLLAVAAKCDVDSWSENKQIELLEDISLEGTGFEGFPVFAGTFNGNGHTISGFRIRGNGYADGFFRYITNTGVVENLKLSGAVESENEEECTGGLCGINAGWILDCTFIGSVEGKSETGGIAGENESGGTISSCHGYGTVTGYDRVGGIVGANYGAVRNCTNKAGINSDSSWLEEEDEAGLEWLIEDMEERKLVSGTDIGGIAGYSRGIVINCSNSGVVGYEHNGYNIGGIVGRQSGQVLFCDNSGRIYGRKDVGGIVGQMEPYISVEEAESISEAAGRLHDLVDSFLDDAGETQDAVSEDFDRLREHSDAALDDADVIADGTVEFVNDNVSAVNELANRLDYCLDQVPGIMDEVQEAVDGMEDVAAALDRAAGALEVSGSMAGSIYDETAYARLSLVSGVGGEVYADSSAPAQGETVTLTITPETGYRLEQLRVEEGSGSTVELTAAGESDGSYSYSFIMPVGNVVAKASFAYSRGTVSGNSVGNGGETPEIILESNTGGKASYSLSGDQVTLTVKPATGYRLQETPQVIYDSDSKIKVSAAGSNSYAFTLPSGAKQVTISLTFGVASDAEAVNGFQNDLSENIRLLQEQMQAVSDSVTKIRELVDGKDIDKLLEEETAEELISAMLELAENLSDAGETLSYIMSDLNSILNTMTPYLEEALKEAGVEIDFVIDGLEDMYTHIDTAFGMIRSTMIYINGKFDIQFAALDDDLDRSVDSLFEQLGMISDYAGQIGEDLDVHSDILEEDMHAINDQINQIFQLFAQRIEDVEDLYYEESGYEDISEKDIDASTDGKVERAVNTGAVQGDVNVGGIAGSMAIDEEDPEGNAAGSVNRSFGSRYLTKCVVNRCENSGWITARKNGAGGIVGYMNLGIVANSEAYGSAESTEGEYVGGVCGESHALIQGCYALASLEGAQYVGGIAGSGSKIRDCYAMVTIGEDAVHQGAIAGWIPTQEDERSEYQEEIRDNYFVSDSLNGIDGVSYAGLAQSVSYEELLETVGLPSAFRHLTITLIAEDRVVEELEVKYHTPLSLVEFPEPPEVAGSYGKWPDVSDQVMESALILEAEYYDTITTLPSVETALAAEAGEPDRPYAYLDGFYTDEAELNVEMTEWTAAQAREEGVRAKADSVVYIVRLSNGGAADTVSKLRLYNPYKEVRAVYRKTGEEGWQEISYQEYGQYLQVEMQGETAEYCILSREGSLLQMLGLGAAAVLVLLLAFAVWRKKGKAKPKPHTDT